MTTCIVHFAKDLHEYHTKPLPANNSTSNNPPPSPPATLAQCTLHLQPFFCPVSRGTIQYLPLGDRLGPFAVSGHILRSNLGCMSTSSYTRFELVKTVKPVNDAAQTFLTSLPAGFVWAVTIAQKVLTVSVPVPDIKLLSHTQCGHEQTWGVRDRWNTFRDYWDQSTHVL